MCCCTKYNTGTKIGDQFFHHRNAGFQIVCREHLSFIKYDNTVGYIMQFSAFRRLICKQGLEKLHIGSHHYRFVPVLRCKLHRLQFFRAFIINIIMIFQDILISQYLSEHFCVLFNNTCIRNHINNTVHMILYRMLKSKCQ